LSHKNSINCRSRVPPPPGGGRGEQPNPFASRRSVHLLSQRQEVHRSATCERARVTCSPLRFAKGARIPHTLRARPGGYEPVGRTFPRSLPPGAGTRESDEKVRRFPVAFKFNLRLNLNARARRFWVLPRTAEDSQICDLVPRPGGRELGQLNFYARTRPFAPRRGGPVLSPPPHGGGLTNLRLRLNCLATGGN